MPEILFEKFDLNGRQMVFDASSFADAFKCLEFYHSRQIERWSPKKENIPARFGKLVHASLEAYDRALLATNYKDAVDVGIAKALELAPLLHLPPDAPKEDFDSARTPQTLVRCVAYYMDKFKDDPYKTVALGGEGAIELRFELALPDRPWRISGRLDRLAQNNGIWIGDRKTTKKTLNARYFTAFMPGIQFPTYIWAGKRLGWEPKGVLVEACQTLVSGCRWERQQIEIWDANIEEFEQNILYMVDAIDRAWESGFWPRNYEACNLYGGCNLKNVCNAMPAQRIRYLQDKFEQRPYQPPESL